MNKYLKLIVLMLIISRPMHAQLKTGSNFYLSNNAALYVNGLYFKAAGNTTALSNRVLSFSGEPIAGKPTSSINQVYTFNEPVALTGTVGIHYQPAALNGNTEANLQIAYFNPVEKYVTTAGGTSDMNGNYISKAFASQSFLRVTAVNANSALPVTLVSFHATREEQQALLSWSTSTETNSDHFEIQRSTDGKNWTAIGTSPATGNSKNRNNYTFPDPSPEPGENLYRLKMVDTDGTYAFSRIVSLHFTEDAVVLLYPNPLSNMLAIEMQNGAAVKSVEVISMQGIRQILKRTDTDQTGAAEYDVSKLPAGSYVIKVTEENGQAVSRKVTKL